MGCVQCGACICAYYGVNQDECCGSFMSPCCYLYSCGMCDFEYLKSHGPCDLHMAMEEEE